MSSGMYRVTIHVVPNLPLTPKQNFHVLECNLCFAGVNGGWEQREWSPCICLTSSSCQKSSSAYLQGRGRNVPRREASTKAQEADSLVASTRRLWCMRERCGRGHFKGPSIYDVHKFFGFLVPTPLLSVSHSRNLIVPLSPFGDPPPPST